MFAPAAAAAPVATLPTAEQKRGVVCLQPAAVCAIVAAAAAVLRHGCGAVVGIQQNAALHTGAHPGVCLQELRNILLLVLSPTEQLQCCNAPIGSSVQ